MSNPLPDHLIALKADRLRPGMFVAALDRLWLHTPFPPNGFYIRDRKQIARICRYCTYVYIDPIKSDEPEDVVVPFDFVAPLELVPVTVRNQVGDEIPWARQALRALTASVREMIRDVRAGRLPEVDALTRQLLPVVDSIQRCPDAALWLMRIEPPSGYVYRRALGTAITATVFGERLGLDREALHDLALGGLLLDIGKVEVPVSILAKRESLSQPEHEIIKRHVAYAQEIMRLMDDVPERVTEMVRSHHERFDGSGYPDKQRGSEIPLFARVAGIVDTYDAITQDRGYAPAISAHTALRYLSGQRHAKFDADLLQEFIHAMGVYPTGTWVELLDGSVGVVCSQNSAWPLTPRIAIMADRSGRPRQPCTVVANRHNPIVNARHSGHPGLDLPNLEAIA